MNSDEVYEIKKTWEVPAANPCESGVAILLQFFKKYPSNQQKFSAFKDLPFNELADNARFKAHATRVIKVFDETIQSLGHDWTGDKLEEIWSKVAVSHFNRKIEKRSFNELREVLLEVLTAACKLNAKQTEAWVKLMDTVYKIMFAEMDKLADDEQ